MVKTIRALEIHWTMRSPNGLEVDTAKLPSHLDCSVCGASTKLGDGRVACERCGALVVTVLVRSPKTSPADGCMGRTGAERPQLETQPNLVMALEALVESRR